MENQHYLYIYEEVCKSLVGTKVAGEIEKIDAEPYDYKIPSTGETIVLYCQISNNSHHAACFWLNGKCSLVHKNSRIFNTSAGMAINCERKPGGQQ